MDKLIVSAPGIEALRAMPKKELAKLLADVKSTVNKGEEIIAEIEKIVAQKTEELKDEIKGKSKEELAEEVSWGEAFRAKHGVSLELATIMSSIMMAILLKVMGL